MNERNFSTAAHGDRSLLCCLTLGVSFRFAAAVSLSSYRRLKKGMGITRRHKRCLGNRGKKVRSLMGS